jgi:chorismate synthase
VAKLFLNAYGIKISAYTSQVGDIKLLKEYSALDLSKTEKNAIRCPDELVAETMIHKIEQIRKAGDTIGGVISCVAKNIPLGLGEPVFDKLHADLGKAMLGINAVKGFEIGSGFEGVKMKGSEHNDSLHLTPTLSPIGEGNKRSEVRTKTNHSGGIQGGISNGEDIYFRVAFKPVATIMQEQATVNNKGELIKLMGKGRHDPCVLPRAVPIVEAMCALVLADHVLRNRTSQI